MAGFLTIDLAWTAERLAIVTDGKVAFDGTSDDLGWPVPPQSDTDDLSP